MDENNNNYENPDLENGNINNENPNISGGTNENNYQNNPYDNPYYNPYFQNGNIDSSPYFDNSNVSNDINQDYMNVNNSQYNNETDLQNLGNQLNNLDNEKGMNNQASNDLQATTEDNSLNMEAPSQAQNDSINLFDLNTSSDELDNSQIDNNQIDNTTNFTDYNNQIENIHINPILGQAINQPQDNNIDVNLNTNQEDFSTQNYSNTLNQDQSSNQYNNSNNEFINEPLNSYGNNNDEEFRKVWMGSLYEKANKRKFSIPSFFFGGLYYLYRKVYLFGFIFLLISCVIPIISMLMIFSNLSNPSSIMLGSILTVILPIIINILYGFAFYPLYKNTINKNLDKFKNEVQNPNQLIELANKKGGTSILFVVLGILLNLIISTIATTTILTASLKSIFNSLFNNNQINNSLNYNVINEPENEYATYDEYNFYKDYYFEYDSSKWIETEDNILTYNNYTISYIQSIENITSAGFDINETTGRSNFYTYLYNLFSSQLDLTTTTLELGSSSFVYYNGIYYSYFDLVYTTSIERCYFVLIPEDDIFIEFILSNNDTIITDAINEEVIEYITSIYKESYQDNSENISNTISNETADNLSTNNVNIEAENNIIETTIENTTTSSNNGIQITSNTTTNNV